MQWLHSQRISLASRRNTIDFATAQLAHEDVCFIFSGYLCHSRQETIFLSRWAASLDKAKGGSATSPRVKGKWARGRVIPGRDVGKLAPQRDGFAGHLH